jgi:hypothetical protein
LLFKAYPLNLDVALYLVTPPETVKALADLAIKYNLVVMSDEIYADQM